MFKKLKQVISFVMMTALLLTGLPLTSVTLAEEEAAEPPIVQDADYSEAVIPSADGIPDTAADVQGSGTPEEAVSLLEQNAGLSADYAGIVANRVYYAPLYAKTDDSGSGALSAAADGNQVDSITAVWLTEDTVDNNNADLLYLNPSEIDPLTVHLQINYSLSGEYNYEPGTVNITIPAQIFRRKDGTLTGGMIIPYPENPSVSGDFNWTLVGDHYVLTNTKQLSAATKGYIQFGITNILPYEIFDMSVTNDFQAKIEVVTRLGNVMGRTSNVISAQVDTFARVKDAHKNYYTNPEIVSASKVPAKNRIDGEEKYVKVTWYAYATIEGSGAYDLVIRDTIPDEYQGTIRDYTDATKRVCESTQENIHQTGQTPYTIYESYYPLSQFAENEDYKIHNDVEFILVETDHKNDADPTPYTTTTAKPAETLFYWSNPKWEGPAPNYNLVKNGNDGKEGENLTRKVSSSKTKSDLHLLDNNYYGIYPTALNDLKDREETEISYTIDTDAKVLPHTFVAEDPTDPLADRKLSNYFKKDVTVLSTDAGMQFGRNNPVSLEPLTDYIFKSVEFADVPYVYTAVAHNINEDGMIDMSSGQDASFLYDKVTDKSRWPVIRLEILRNNTWESWAEADWTNGTLKITLKDGSMQSKPVVALPADTENFRTVVTFGGDSEKKIAGIEYNIRPVIALQPTNKITTIVDEAFAELNAPTLNASNNAYMQAFTDYPANPQNIMNTEMIVSEGRDSLRGYTTDVEVMPEKTGSQDMDLDVDPEKRLVTVHYQAKVEEKTVIHEKKTYEQAVRDGRITSETGGTWYDLLPAGVEPLTDTIKLRKDDAIEDIQTIPNYKGSNRTLLIVKARLTNCPETYKKADMYYYEDVPSISFDAVYSFESVIDYGPDIHNVIAFESDNDHIGEVDRYSGEPDNPNGYASATAEHSKGNQHTATKKAFADSKEIEWMTDLDPERDDPSFVYAGKLLTIHMEMAAQTSLNKEVEVNRCGTWTTGLGKEDTEINTVWSGGIYRYRLRMESNTDTVTKDMILYDILENYFPSDANGHPEDVDAPRWEGTLMDVNVEQLKAKGCAPVVYYCTLPKSSIVLEDATDKEVLNPAYGSLSNTAVWTKAEDYTGALSAVTAIAVDASKKTDGSDFELYPQQAISVYVSMISPSILDEDPVKKQAAQAAIDNHAHAYNNVYLYASSVNAQTPDAHDLRLIRKDYTKVGIKAYEIEVAKQWSDDDDRDRIRPESATVALYRNGEPTGLKLTLNEGNDFHGTFTGIPLLHPLTGEQYHYTFVEDPVDGYRPGLMISNNRVIITNVHTPERVSLSGVKNWVGDNEDTRPEYITVKLFADGTYLKEMQVRAPWEYTFADLYKYQDGHEISYTIVEDTNGLDSYVSEVDQTNLTNTYHPYGNLEVKKITENTTPAASEVSFPLTFTFTKTEFGDVKPVLDSFPYTILNEQEQEIGSGTVMSGGSVSIKGGQTIRFTDLPENLQYKIEETQQSGFTLQSGSNLESSITANQTKKAELTNVYEATGELVIPARKTLNGRKLDPSQFRFELLDETTGEVIRTASNSAADTVEFTDPSNTTVSSSSAPVNFGTIRYTQNDIGTHQYTIREVNSAKDGYTYDPAQYHATVVVSDDGTGTLKTQVSYTKEGEGDTESVSFTNAYEASGSVSLLAWKDLKGRKAEAGEFTFNLCDRIGNVLKSAVNAADGTIRFEAIDYDQTDIGKTYYYMIKEQTGTDPAVNYDTSVYGFKVDISDNGDGTLSIQQTKAQPVFDPELPGVIRSWNTEDAPLQVFENTLKPGSLSVSKHVTNAEDANPAQEFHFKIRFIGENAPTELNYSIESAAAADDSATDDSATDDPVAQTGKAETSSLSWIERLLGVTEVQAAEDDIAGGTYDGVHWRITKEGALILGSGGSETLTSRSGRSVDDPNDKGQPYYWPWHDYYDQITSVKVSGDVYANSGSLEDMFRDLGKASPEIMTTIDLSGLHTSGVTNMRTMFYDCRATEIIFGSYFDTSSVTTMSNMFNNCTRVKSLDLSNFDTRNVTNMYYLFAYCNSATSITLGENFNTKKVTGSGMAGMFRACINLPSVDFSNCVVDPSHADSLWAMFADCWKLETIDLGDNFDTSNISNFSDMFWNSYEEKSNLKSIRFGDKFNTSSATTMKNMFKLCEKLESLDLTFFNSGDSNTSSVTDMSQMFFGCKSLTSLTLSSSSDPNVDFDTSSVTDMSYMFYGCTSLKELDLGSKFDTGNVKKMNHMFAHCENLDSLDLRGNFNTANVNTMAYMFYKCFKLPSLTLGNQFDTAKVTDMKCMFCNCMALQALDLGGLFDTSNVTTNIRLNDQNEVSYQSGGMDYMFSDCNSLQSLILGDKFDTSNVTNMDHMFNGLEKLPSLDLGAKFNTSNVTNMKYMFYNCSSLPSLNLGTQFNTANVTDMDHMFRGISSIKELDLGDLFNTSKVTNMNSMFKFARNLEKLDLGPSFKVAESVDTTKFFNEDYKLKWVSIPAGFRFNNDSILPKPSTETPYTGKWTKEDGSLLDPVTEEDVKNLFNQSSNDAPGVWVWEETSTNFTLLFDGNGGAGSMPFVKIHADLANKIPQNQFVRFGYEFDGWETTYEEKTYTYADKDTIPANTFPIGAKVTLKAKWKEKSTIVDLKEGEGEFTLHANEKAVFEGLAAGTAYQVYEETPDGWVLVSQSGTSGTIESLKEAKADFTNKYQPNLTTAQFSGTKTLDGEAALAGAFRFALYEGDTQIGETVETKEGGLFQFPVITYGVTDVGTHTYTIKEVKDDSKETIIWDEHEETVKVEVTSDDDGLHSKTTYDSTGVVFDNATKPGSLEIHKTAVNASAANENDVFTFAIRLAQANGTPLSGNVAIFMQTGSSDKLPVTMNQDGVFNATCKAGESIVVTNIPAGSTYSVQEEQIPSGWTLTSSTDSEGSIAANATAETTFTNTYAAQGSIVLTAHKQLVGATPEAGDFTFELLGTDKTVLDTKTNGALDTEETIPNQIPAQPNPWVGTAPVVFDALSFTHDDIGTKTYYIREQAGTNDKIIYDTKVVKVTVTIADAGGGLLSVTAAYDDAQKEPLFVNEMKDGALSIRKVIQNETDESADSEFPFRFTLTDASGETITGTYDITVKHADPEADETTGTWKTGEALNLKGGDTVTVSGLPHGASYQITETTDHGWTQVAQTGDSGRIEADETAESTFTNSYHTEGEAEIKADKTLVGGNLAEHSFNFELLDESMMPIGSAQSDKDGKIVFDPIHYDNTQVGKTLTYFIHEIPDENDTSIHYDSTYRKVTVQVSDKGDGTMTCDVAYPEGNTVTNYMLKNLSVHKTVTGNNASLSTPFAFKVTFHADDKPFNPVTWTKGSESGTISAEGTFEFSLKHDETISFNGITYGTGYEVVEDDANKNGYLTTAEGDVSGTMNADKEVNFINKKEMNVPTAQRFGILGGIILILLAMSGLSILTLLRLRRRNRG